MREGPMLMSGPMVRATLADVDPKTQTRRVILPQPEVMSLLDEQGRDIGPHWTMYTDSPDQKKRSAWPIDGEPHWTHCPYGQPGDRLWVRESFAVVPRLAGCERAHPHDPYHGVRYRATWDRAHYGGWKPSIHMPRWASRISLEITNVRVERVQDASVEDVLAEGIAPRDDMPTRMGKIVSELSAFSDLWDSLNADRGYGWDANPWVWVLEFRRVV